MVSEPQASPLAPLGREEYIEQAHFFRALAERLEANVPAQEVLASVREEVLATTKLPLAIDFLLGELRHEGVLGPAMSPAASLLHAVSGVRRSRNRRTNGCDLICESGWKSCAARPNIGRTNRLDQGIFLYQFEVLCRNRLGYDRGLEAIASDPAFDGVWRDWIRKLRRQIGMVDLADVIYVHSEYYWQRNAKLGTEPTAREQSDSDARASRLVESGGAISCSANARAGSRWPIARRTRSYLFSSLHRQLGYPEVPRVKPADQGTGAAAAASSPAGAARNAAENHRRRAARRPRFDASSTSARRRSDLKTRLNRAGKSARLSWPAPRPVGKQPPLSVVPVK